MTIAGFEPCGRAPIGILTNCVAMGCAADGCVMARPQAVVSLEDLILPGGPCRCGHARTLHSTGPCGVTGCGCNWWGPSHS